MVNKDNNVSFYIILAIIVFVVVVLGVIVANKISGSSLVLSPATYTASGDVNPEATTWTTATFRSGQEVTFRGNDDGSLSMRQEDGSNVQIHGVPVIKSTGYHTWEVYFR